jgi:hypothetical protein
MLHTGQYIRLRIAPNTRMGTITGSHVEGTRTEYVFHHDERFHDRTPDFYVLEEEVEPWERPSDEHVALINRLTQSSLPTRR